MTDPSSSEWPAGRAREAAPPAGVPRDFVPEDQEAVRKLVLGGMRARWGDTFDSSANPDLDDIWSNYTRRGAEVVVIDADGQPVATGTLVAELDGSGRIVRMAVDPSHRRRGLARRIVAELVERARRRGMRRLAVTTDTPWSSAVALYRSCGFNLTGQTTEATDFSMPLEPAPQTSEDRA